MSERDGWNHLYLYDATHRPGEEPDHPRRMGRAGRGSRRRRQAADLVRRRRHPIRARTRTYIHYCRINFDGTGLAVLTEGDGDHDVAYSPGRAIPHRHLVARGPAAGDRAAPRRRRASWSASLKKADAGELLAGAIGFPEPFVAKGRDGETDIYGVIFRPADFDPAKKYPVVEDIYAGPQDSYVPKSFQADLGAAEAGRPRLHRRADRRHGHEQPLEEIPRCLLEEPGRRRLPRPHRLDEGRRRTGPGDGPARVGIFGGSAGGQNALGALLFHGDFYKVAVADCGCHDNRMDKIWWNEQWMGWPVGPEYERSSNVANAANSTGKLMLLSANWTTTSTRPPRCRS